MSLPSTIQRFGCGAAVALSTLLASQSLAQDENDVLMCSVVGEPSLLATGNVDSISGNLAVGARVFQESTETVGNDDWRGDEGFFAVTDPEALPADYAPLPALTDIRFDFKAFAIGAATSNLWYWDPSASAAVNFVVPVDGQRLSFRKSPTQFFNSTVTGLPVDVTGFTIDRTSSNGLIHRHLTIVLDDADTDAETPVPVGVYVVALQLSTASASAPIIFEVINGGMGPSGDAFVDLAVDFVEDLIAPQPQCPGDVDGDGDVDLTDLASLLANFGVASGAARDDGDLDGDGDVDLTDLASLLGNFGSACA